MKEKPITFSSKMVKAILEDQKIMTRRPLKPQPTKDNIACIDREFHDSNTFGCGKFSVLMTLPFSIQ